MHTLKPLDNEAVDACINDIGKIITVEDHNIINGLGSAVCERAAEAREGQGRAHRHTGLLRPVRARMSAYLQSTALRLRISLKKQ